MNFDLDVIKMFRDTLDWGVENGKSIIKFRNKSKLTKIINAISNLIAHKKLYLYNIKSAIATKDTIKIESAINESLLIAEQDTTALLSVIEDAGFKNSEIYRVLKTKAEVLANTKLQEINRVKQIIDNTEELDKATNTDILELLSSFENRWDEISTELENIKKAASKT